MRNLIHVVGVMLAFALSACVGSPGTVNTNTGQTPVTLDPVAIAQLACGVARNDAVQAVASLIRNSGGTVGGVEGLVHQVTSIVCPSQAAAGLAVARARAAMAERGVTRAVVTVR